MTRALSGPDAAGADPPPPARSRSRTAARLGSLRPDTTRKRIWTLTTVALLALAAMFTAAGLALTQARDGLHVIGHGAGPQVMATADLYYALSDMEAQVVNVLLMGDEHHLGDGREAALERYDQRRREANTALVQAAQLAAGDATELRNVEDLLDGLGRYEQLAGEAVLLSEQHEHEPGPPPDDVLEVHREATDLMRLQLLPKAYNLTLEQGSVVRTTYEERRSAVQSGALATAATGAAALAALIALQLYLRRRFRRRFNPPLAAATAAVAVLAASGAAFLATEVRHLDTAKEDGFDSVLTLAQARAIGIGMHSGQARYILAPDQAEAYEQVYLADSQTLLYVLGGTEDGGHAPATSLADYYAAVETGVRAYPEPVGGEPMRGFLGDEAQEVTLEGQEGAIRDVLGDYAQFQQRDEVLRAMLDRGLTRGGIDFVLGSEGATARHWFERYDESLVELSMLHQQTFEEAIADGQRYLALWSWLLPLSAVATTALILAGVRPRVAEYR